MAPGSDSASIAYHSSSVNAESIGVSASSPVSSWGDELKVIMLSCLEEYCLIRLNYNQSRKDKHDDRGAKCIGRFTLFLV